MYVCVSEGEAKERMLTLALVYGSSFSHCPPPACPSLSFTLRFGRAPVRPAKQTNQGPGRDASLDRNSACHCASLVLRCPVSRSRSGAVPCRDLYNRLHCPCPAYHRHPSKAKSYYRIFYIHTRLVRTARSLPRKFLTCKAPHHSASCYCFRSLLDRV